MRSTTSLRTGGLAGACLVAGLAAAGPAPAQSSAPAPGAGVPFELGDASLRYGQRTAATGVLRRELAGRRVSLELRTRAAGWRELAAAPAGADGRYRITTRVPRSGALRVTVAPAPGEVAAASRPASAERRVRVTARLGVGSRRLDVAAGRRAAASGTVRPGVAGLPVSLQVRSGGRWRTLGRDRTSRGGRYAITGRRRAAGSAPARVVVSGAKAGVGSARRSLGRLNVYRTAAASWYGPGLYGNPLGCGGTLRPGMLGVAHKTLPCGTKVTFRRGSRSIRVAVIDRGPYVGGREYDLTEATAQRLGFRGHGAIQATR